jgi:hypothetical protein
MTFDKSNNETDRLYAGVSGEKPAEITAVNGGG